MGVVIYGERVIDKSLHIGFFLLPYNVQISFINTKLFPNCPNSVATMTYIPIGIKVKHTTTNTEYSL